MLSVKGYVSGRVQGVGFRYFVSRHAQVEKLTGYALNLSDGRVEFLLQGDSAAIDRVVVQIRTGPSHARVSAVELDAACETPARSGFSTR